MSATAYANDIPAPVVSSYMADYGVSQAEAVRRLGIMSNSSLISHALIDKFGESLIAGVFFEHSPEFKIIVRTTKQGQKARDVLSFVGKEMPDLNIEVIPNSPRNFRSIENIIANQFSVLDKKVKGLQSIGYDPAKDEIVITIYDPTAQSADELQKRHKLDKLSGMSARVELAIAPIAANSMGGGLSLSDVTGSCTSGFAVNVNGQAGIVTAYHCTRNETVKNYTIINGQSRYNLVLHPPKPSANHDMAVYLAPKGTTMTPKVSLGAGILSDIKAQGGRSSLKVGQSYLCHYGISSGFSCGTVGTIKHSLGSKFTDGTQICNTTKRNCNPVFISISSPQLRCMAGDSGGPVVEGNTAYGIVSSCNLEEIQKGRRAILYLSSLDYLNELPATLLQSTN